MQMRVVFKTIILTNWLGAVFLLIGLLTKQKWNEQISQQRDRGYEMFDLLLTLFARIKIIGLLFGRIRSCKHI
ncbi:hypothetical protein DYD21_08860 [Rhodohalobacter sp. SW132]|nr:hypothetical protein DYD21_08860 [Rhodohalobacter sp. SW132]